MATQRYSAKDAARELGTDARTLRKFLRSKSSPIEPVGQGKRYDFSKADIKEMKKAFLTWSTKPARVGAKKQSPVDLPNPDPGAGRHDIEHLLDDPPSEPHEDSDMDGDFELDDLEGPDDEDLFDIELED